MRGLGASLRFSRHTRGVLILTAIGAIVLTWLVCSTMGPPVRTDGSGNYRLLRTPYGSH